MQSKRQSAIEAAANTAIGFLGSYLITYLAMTQMKASPSALSLTIVILCTLWSLIRGYWVRRFFNKKG